MTALGVSIPTPIVAVIGLLSGVLLILAVWDLLKGNLEGAVTRGIGFGLTAFIFIDGLQEGPLTTWVANFLTRVGNSLLE